MNLLVDVGDEDDDHKSVELCVIAKKLMIQSNEADCAASAVVGGPLVISDNEEGNPTVDGDGDLDGARGRWFVGNGSRMLVSSSQE